MATVTPSINVVQGNAVVTWEAIASGDTIVAAEIFNRQGLAFAVQISGTFGGATAKLQASNDGVQWFDLNDFEGTAISATDNALFDGGTGARYVRPAISGGTSDDVDVVLVLRGV